MSLKCLRAALDEVRQMDPADGDAQYLEVGLRRLIDSRVLDEQQKLAKANLLMAQMETAALRREVGERLTEARLQLWEVETDGFSPDALPAFRDTIEMSADPTVVRTRPDAASEIVSQQHIYMSRLNALFDEYFTGFVARPKDTLNLSRELLGVRTGDPVAERAAAAYREVMSDLIANLRKNGVFVEEMPNYRPQNLAPAKLASDKDVALREMADLLDPEWHPDPVESAAHIYDTLMTRHTLEPGDQPLTMGRKVHYRTDDPDRLHAFLEQFGEDTLIRQIERDVKRMVRAEVLSRSFGPDPARAVKSALRQFERNAASQGHGWRVEQSARNAGAVFDALTGTLDTPHNARMANVMSGFRAMMSTIMLGKVAMAVVAQDSFIAPFQRARVEGFGRAFSLQAQGTMAMFSRETRQKLQQYYATMEPAFWMGSPNSRFSPDAAAEGFAGQMQKVGAGFYRASGAWDLEQALRGATSFSLGRSLGDAATVPWRDLDPRIQQDFANSGITERIWREVNERGVVDADGLFSWEGLRLDAQRSVAAYFHRTLNHAVLRPDNATRALLFAGSRRGSLAGELAAGVTQFLSWPISFARLVMYRQIKAGLPGAAVFAGGMYATAMITEQLYALAGDQPFYEWDSEALHQRATVRSGLLTPVGEWMYGSLTGNEFNQPGLGPLVDTGVGLLGSGYKAARAAIDGETDKAAAEIVRQGVRLTPNTWWFESTIIQPTMTNVMWSLDPEYMRRRESRYRDEERMGY